MKPIMLIGPPGSGKGTQGKMIAGYFGIPHISTGEILRDHVERGTVIGYCVKETLSKGLLVPDELMTDLITSRLRLEDAVDGYVLDGFPRTVPQAQWFYAHYEQPLVFLLDVPEEIAFNRIANRKEGRVDDTEAQIVFGRLDEYKQRTEPLIGYYEREARLYRVDGTRSAGETFEWIKNLLESKEAIAYG